MAFGSDYPYEHTFDPFQGIINVTGRQLGKSLTALEAVNTYTQGSAYAEFSENKKGLIKEGMQADFFVTAENPLNKVNYGKKAINSVYTRGFCVFNN